MSLEGTVRLMAAACLSLAVAAVSPTAAAAPRSAHRAHGPCAVGSDFDHDGFADLVITAPNETLSSTRAAGGGGQGAVHVLHGAATGLTAMGSQVWTEDSPGVPGVAEENDHFGLRAESGDFDCDGFADLAVGLSGEDRGGLDGTGGVVVLYGSPAGLKATRSQFWDQDSPGVGGRNEGGEEFGYALQTGDFDGDGVDDLAVGSASDRVGSVDLAGSVTVLFGSAGGLTAHGNQLWSQASPGVAGRPEAYDLFGNSFGTGDLNGDGIDDLAIGIPGESTPAALSLGQAEVLYGSHDGLTSVESQAWSQDTAGVGGTADQGDYFGQRLAVGDLNADGYADLAIGVPGESVNGQPSAGRVNVLFGSGRGLVAANDEQWSQGDPGIAGKPQIPDQFGFGLVVADLDGDGVGDLVVGAPDDSSPAAEQAGAVHVIRGSQGGLTSAGSHFWTQDSPGVKDAREFGDLFGLDTAVADFNGDGHLDLAIGAGDEDIGDLMDAGAVNVLYGTASGLASTHDQLWTQDSEGIGEDAETQDGFGLEVAAS